MHVKQSKIMMNLFSRRRERLPLFFTTDVHCHVIPGVDHGSPDPATSIELLKRMSSWGLRRIVGTPHVTEDVFVNNPDTLVPAAASLRAAVEKANMDMEIVQSAEYRIDNLFRSQIESGQLCPFPGGYILVENSFVQEPWGLEELLFDLKIKGLRPILAHPERYLYYHSRPERYKALHSAGTLFQVNLLSLAGYHGKDEKKMAERLIEEGMADFIGTDLHHHRHADFIEDYLVTKDYRRHSEILTGRILNDSLEF